MGLKGLTVNTAPEAEPHIYAEDDAAIYQAICGSDGVFEIGQKCESQVISNNKVRVKDGVIIVGGHFARIPYGDYIDFEIANGQTGKKRNDILIAKFVTTGSGGIDTFTGEVKQGAAAEEATDPALTQNDLYQGGKIREIPLYRVKLDGLSIVAVEPMFNLIPTIPTLNMSLSYLNGNLKIEIVRFTTGPQINTDYTFPLPEGYYFYNTALLSLQVTVGSSMRDGLNGGFIESGYTGLYRVIDQNAVNQDAFALICKYR